MAHTVKEPLTVCEKFVATVLVSIVAIAGSGMLFKLQYHLRSTRMIIDPSDTIPWRGLDVVIGLVIALIISAIAVCYSLWR
jgi:hypothetical protein